MFAIYIIVAMLLFLSCALTCRFVPSFQKHIDNDTIILVSLVCLFWFVLAPFVLLFGVLFVIFGAFIIAFNLIATGKVLSYRQVKDEFLCNTPGSDYRGPR